MFTAQIPPLKWWVQLQVYTHINWHAPPAEALSGLYKVSSQRSQHICIIYREGQLDCQVVQTTGNLSVRSHILAFFSCIKQDWLSVLNTVTQSFVCGYFTRAAPSLFEVLERTAALWPAYTNTYKDNLVLQQKVGRYSDTGILTFFTSRYASRPYSPSSRPFPDAL